MNNHHSEQPTARVALQRCPILLTAVQNLHQEYSFVKSTKSGRWGRDNLPDDVFLRSRDNHVEGSNDLAGYGNKVRVFGRESNPDYARTEDSFIVS